MTAFVRYSLKGQPHRLACKEVTTLGRDPASDIVFDDPLVSRRHAMICRVQDDSYYLIDEGSSNGSQLNARRIALPTRLNPGDQITIGPVTLHFEQTGAPRAAATDTGESRVTTVVVSPTVEVVQNAILVADIRGFTRLSESLPVRKLTALMNEWFRAATGCIKERHGIVDKFLGDCVYARWETAHDPQRAVIRAIDAACRLHELSRDMNARYPELTQPFDIGAGVNFGIAAIGTDQGRTAIGDAVNLTFRLQEKTKELGTNVLIAQDAYRHFAEELWSGREREISVAGKTQPVNVCGYSFEEAAALLRRGDSTLTL